MSDFGFLSPGRLAILILPIALTLGYLLLQGAAAPLRGAVHDRRDARSGRP